MSAYETAISVVFVGAFVLGARSTWHLYDRWAADQVRPRSVILFAFVIVAAALTVTAGWVGFLSVRRLLGFEPFGWTSLVTTLLAIVIVLIPVFLDWLADAIEAGRWSR